MRLGFRLVVSKAERERRLFMEVLADLAEFFSFNKSLRSRMIYLWTDLIDIWKEVWEED
jgi:hypothetical protein